VTQNGPSTVVAAADPHDALNEYKMKQNGPATVVAAANSHLTKLPSFMTYPNNISLTKKPPTKAQIQTPKPAKIAQLLFIQIQLDFHPIKTLIDTGANLDIVNSRIIKKFNFHTHNIKPFKIKGYSTEISQTVQTTTQLPTKIE
jgi:hypothetical protein